MKSRSVHLDNNYLNSFYELKFVHMANSEFFWKAHYTSYFCYIILEL